MTRKSAGSPSAQKPGYERNSEPKGTTAPAWGLWHCYLLHLAFASAEQQGNLWWRKFSGVAAPIPSITGDSAAKASHRVPPNFHTSWFGHTSPFHETFMSVVCSNSLSGCRLCLRIVFLWISSMALLKRIGDLGLPCLPCFDDAKHSFLHVLLIFLDIGMALTDKLPPWS